MSLCSVSPTTWPFTVDDSEWRMSTPARLRLLPSCFARNHRYKYPSYHASLLFPSFFLQLSSPLRLWATASGGSSSRPSLSASLLALLSPSALSYNIYHHLVPFYTLYLFPSHRPAEHLPPLYFATSPPSLPIPNPNTSTHQSTTKYQKKHRTEKNKQTHSQLSKLKILTRAYQTEYASTSSDINGPLVGWLGTGLGYQMRCVRSGNEFLYLCF
jgi:hypothetical protein